MKRREFIGNVALGTAIGSVAGMGSCLPNSDKKFVDSFPDPNGKPPLLEKYASCQRIRSGIALGGIGAGSVELRKNGQFYNWTIMNNYPFGAGSVFEIPQFPRNGWEDSLLFFIVRYQEEGEQAKLKLLQIGDGLDQGGMESIEYYFPWLESVSEIEYRGRFPFIHMKFKDPDMPFDIELEAFSPFIPHDIKNSSLPGVFFNFKLHPKGKNKVDVLLTASLRNLVGYDTTDKYFTSSLTQQEGIKYFDLSAGRMDETRSSFGHMGLASLSEQSSWYLGWEHRHPYYEKLLVERELANIDDTEGRNRIDRESGLKTGRHSNENYDQRHFSSIARRISLEGGKSFDHSFILSWYFPNNYGSVNGRGKEEDRKPYHIGQVITRDEGHYYSRFFNSAEEVALYMAENKKILEDQSKLFLNSFYASNIPQFALDQVNSHLNTFITSGRLTRDGLFAIREGMTPDKSWGPMATTDVSLYGSIPVLSLFPELQKATIRAHMGVQTPKGEIAHGLGLDLSMTQNGTWGVYDRIDLPGQFVQMALRDFFFTNDGEFLNEIWPSVKKAILYILDYRDDDGNQMPYIKGIECSYDNFPMYGMASYIQSQWLCALKSAIKAGKILKDEEKTGEWEEIFKKGSGLMDSRLWNGKYYRLYNDEGGAVKGDKSEGCLTDQVIGQWVAHISGLGYLFSEENVKSALRSVLELSYREGFGLRNCSWPEYPERFPIEKSDLWVDQANTPWTGVELAFASFLIFEGMVDEGLKVIKTVDERYRKSGLYWDHQEFGGHYYRPMSSWAILNAFSGFSLCCDGYAFHPKCTENVFRLFFSGPEGYCFYEKTKNSVVIQLISGKMTIRSIRIKSHNLTGKNITVEVSSSEASHEKEFSKDELYIQFREAVRLISGERISISSAP